MCSDELKSIIPPKPSLCLTCADSLHPFTIKLENCWSSWFALWHLGIELSPYPHLSLLLHSLISPGAQISSSPPYRLTILSSFSNSRTPIGVASSRCAPSMELKKRIYCNFETPCKICILFKYNFKLKNDNIVLFSFYNLHHIWLLK